MNVSVYLDNLHRRNNLIVLVHVAELPSTLDEASEDNSPSLFTISLVTISYELPSQEKRTKLLYLCLCECGHACMLESYHVKDRI